MRRRAAAAIVLLLGAAGCTSRPIAGSPAGRAGPPAVVHSAAPAAGRPASFTLIVRTGHGELAAHVAPMSVPSGRPVDPPHRTPAEWNTAVWLIGASDPAHPSGTTYVYGHACHHHACPFTRLHEAGTGDVVLVVTANGVQRYRVERIGYVAKAAGVLPGWASDSTATGRIVLVTCAYEHGDVSTQNLVVVAQQN